MGILYTINVFLQYVEQCHNKRCFPSAIGLLDETSDYENLRCQ